MDEAENDVYDTHHEDSPVGTDAGIPLSRLDAGIDEKILPALHLAAVPQGGAAIGLTNLIYSATAGARYESRFGIGT